MICAVFGTSPLRTGALVELEGSPLKRGLRDAAELMRPYAFVYIYTNVHTKWIIHGASYLRAPCDRRPFTGEADPKLAGPRIGESRPGTQFGYIRARQPALGDCTCDRPTIMMSRTAK